MNIHLNKCDLMIALGRHIDVTKITSIEPFYATAATDFAQGAKIAYFGTFKGAGMGLNTKYRGEQQIHSEDLLFNYIDPEANFNTFLGVKIHFADVLDNYPLAAGSYHVINDSDSTPTGGGQIQAFDDSSGERTTYNTAEVNDQSIVVLDDQFFASISHREYISLDFLDVRGDSYYRELSIKVSDLKAATSIRFVPTTEF